MNKLTPKCTATGGIIPIKDFCFLLKYKSTKYALMRARAAATARGYDVDRVVLKIRSRWFVAITANAREYLERKKAAESAERLAWFHEAMK